MNHEAKIPLVFGITGHRDIRPQDLEELKAAVTIIFNEIRERYSHSPLALLSPLAEGADRLVAKVALENGVELIVPLPMAQAEYEKDFVNPGSLEEFRNLVGEASKVTEMPLPEGITPDDISAHGEHRNRQYEQAGIYVALHSHILIALWDGKETHKTGGTGAIVRYQLNGIPPPDSDPGNFCRDHGAYIDIPESGPVYHITTPRLAAGAHAVDSEMLPSIKLTKIYPSEEPVSGVDDEERFHVLLKLLDVYNRDVEILAKKVDGAYQASRGYLLPDSKMDAFGHLQELRSRFAMANVLAVRFRDRAHRALTGLAALSVSVFLIFEIFAHIFPLPVVLSMYIAMLSLPWAFYFMIIRPKNWQPKYEDNRALAEAIRVQFYWHMANMPCGVADLYSDWQRDDMIWIRQSVRACNILGRAQGTANEIKSEPLKDIQKYWVADQHSYFDRTSKREGALLKKRNRFIWGFYWSGILLAVTLLFLMLYVGKLDTKIHWYEVTIALMGFAPICAATIGFVIERRGFEVQVKRYRRSHKSFGIALDRLAQIDNDVRQDATGRQQDTRKLLHDIGVVALAENADWLVMHRGRRIEPLIG